MSARWPWWPWIFNVCAPLLNSAHLVPCVQVAIKKVLQDKRFKNRELQIMKMMDHPNVVSLKHCFYSTTEKDEVRITDRVLLLHGSSSLYVLLQNLAAPACSDKNCCLPHCHCH